MFVEKLLETKIVSKFIYFDKEDFIACYEGEEFKSPKALKLWICASLPSLLKHQSQLIEVDHIFFSPRFAKPKKIDLAVFSHGKVGKIALIAGFKIEEKMGRKRPIDTDLKDARRRVFIQMQITQCKYGILFTEKRCYFLQADFDDQGRLLQPYLLDRLRKNVLR